MATSSGNVLSNLVEQVPEIWEQKLVDVLTYKGPGQESHCAEKHSRVAIYVSHKRKLMGSKKSKQVGKHYVVKERPVCESRMASNLQSQVANLTKE